jgi:glycosyltransferase involved in cell wall biosynthesis
MSVKPKISVIIPVHNAERFLENCLDTVKNQTFKDFEVICINDCSTDSSLDILNKYAKDDSRFKIFTNEKSLMAGGSRNKGLTLASGEYIHFLDADDWIDERLYEKSYRKILKNKLELLIFDVVSYDDVSMITQDFEFINLSPFKEYNPELMDKTFSNRDFLEVMFKLCLAPWNKIYKKDFLDKHKINFPEGRWYEDMLFFFLVWLKADKVSTLDEKMLTYRMNISTSMIGSKDRKYFDFFANYNDIEKTLKQNGVFEKIKYKFYAFKYCGLYHWHSSINEDLKDEFMQKTYEDIESNNFSIDELINIMNNMQYGTEAIRKIYISKLTISKKIQDFFFRIEVREKQTKFKVLGFSIFKKQIKEGITRAYVLGIKVGKKKNG